MINLSYVALRQGQASHTVSGIPLTEPRWGSAGDTVAPGALQPPQHRSQRRARVAVACGGATCARPRRRGAAAVVVPDGRHDPAAATGAELGPDADLPLSVASGHDGYFLRGLALAHPEHRAVRGRVRPGRPAPVLVRGTGSRPSRHPEESWTRRPPTMWRSICAGNHAATGRGAGPDSATSAESPDPHTRRPSSSI